jgi:hypothetical protein
MEKVPYRGSKILEWYVNLPGSFCLVQVTWYVFLYMRKNLQNWAETIGRLCKNLVAAATRRPGFVHRCFLWSPKVHTQHYTQSWTIWIKYTLFHTTSFKIHLNTTFPVTPRSSKISSRFRTKMFYQFLSSHESYCSVCLILFDFIFRIVFGEE